MMFIVIDTRIGRIGAVSNSDALIRIELNCPAEDEFKRLLENNYHDEAISDPENSLLKKASNQIIEYLDGKRKHFDLQIELRCSKFYRAVLEAAARIPYGDVKTYGEIASSVTGSNRAARAVGGAVGANPLPIIIPCHRVTAAGGKLGGFGGGLELKRKLLDLETKNK